MELASGPAGRFHVHIEYENEQLALGAIRLGARLVEAAICDRLAKVDLPRELERLRAVAEIGASLRGRVDERYPPRLLTLAAARAGGE